MRNILQTTLLSTMIFSANISQTHAAAAAVTLLFNPVVAGNIAITGLAITGAGTMSTVIWPDKDCDNGNCLAPLVLGIAIGLIFLDEETQSYKFKSIDSKLENKLSLSSNDVRIYNSELEQVNVLLEEVSSKMHKGITSDEVSQQWDNVKNFVSPETFKVMQILSTAQNN